MDILMHKYGKDGRLEKTFASHSDVDVKLEDLKPPKWCVFAEQNPLPKYDKETEVPVMTPPDKTGSWVVKKKAYFERPDGNNEWDEELGAWVEIIQPEPELSILDSENLIKTIIALKDKAELGTEIPTEIATLVEAERVKLEPVAEEPIIKEITK